MSENIKVSEVSDILRHQLEGIDTRVQLDEIGTVLQVSDGVARIYGLRNAEANELLEFDNGIKAIVMNLEEDNVGAVLLGPTAYQANCFHYGGRGYAGTCYRSLGITTGW